MAQARADDTTEFTTVGMTVEARDALVAYCKRRYGMAARDVLTALVKWFVDQPTPVQNGILIEMTAELEEPYAAALEAMASGIRERAARRGGGNGDTPHRTSGPTPKRK